MIYFRLAVFALGVAFAMLAGSFFHDGFTAMAATFFVIAIVCMIVFGLTFKENRP